MPIISGSRVSFTYVRGSTLPASPDDNTIYYLEGAAQIYVGSHLMADKSEVYYNTSSYWASQTGLISSEGAIYIYSDYRVDASENNIPGIKIGDGSTVVDNLPFIDVLYDAHIQDLVIHITAAERAAWNNKVSCYIDQSDSENIVFTTNNITM